VAQVGGVQVLAEPAARLAAQQLALVEAALGVDAPLVVGEGGDLLVAQELELGDADAVLARDHAAEPARQRHDAADRHVRGLQHLVVVGVDRDVRVHVAVAGVHVQRHPDAAAQHLAVEAPALREHRLEGRAGEQPGQRLQHLRLPGGAQAAVLQALEEAARSPSGAGRRSSCCSHCDHSARTSPSSASACCTRSSSSSALGISRRRRPCQRQLALGEEGLQRSSSASLLRSDSSMLMRSMPSVYSPMRVERDHHVLVDLEGVGVLADGGGALAVEPELLARVGLDRDEALAARLLAMRTTSLAARATASASSPDDVADQHHLRQAASMPRRARLLLVV
jgi:hypothetical protein